MAQDVLDLILRTKKQGNAPEETKKGLEGLKQSFANIQPVIGVAGVAVGALAGALKYAVGEAAQAQLASAQLEAVLKSTGGVAGITKDELEDLADGLSKMSGVEDDLILKNEAVMLTFTKIGKDTFPGAMEAALNMSVALGQDLQGSVIQVGKALQDPILGVTALRRVGVNFSKDQQNVIKALVDTGKEAEAQAYILAELNTEFGGAAKAAGDTYVGAMNKAKVAVGNMAETVGMQLLPALTDGLNAFTDWINAIEATRTAIVTQTEQVSDSTLTYEDYRAQMEAVIRESGYWVDENGNVYRSVSDLRHGVEYADQSIRLMTKAQWEAHAVEVALGDPRAESIALLRQLDEATEGVTEANDELTASEYEGIDVLGIAIKAVKDSNAALQTKIDLEEKLMLMSGKLTEEELELRDAVGFLTSMLEDGKLTQEEYLALVQQLAMDGSLAAEVVKGLGNAILLLPSSKDIHINVKYHKYGKEDPDAPVITPPEDYVPGPKPGGQMGGQVWPWQAVRWQEPAAGSEILITNRQGYILNMRQAQDALAGAMGGEQTVNNFYLSANYANMQSESALSDDVRMLMQLYGRG